MECAKNDCILELCFVVASIVHKQKAGEDSDHRCFVLNKTKRERERDSSINHATHSTLLLRTCLLFFFFFLFHRREDRNVSVCVCVCCFLFAVVQFFF